MKFFYGCASAEEAKEIYRKLAKCFHPDKGGSVELMKELTDQYDNWDAPIESPKPFNTFTPDNMGNWRSFGFNRMNEFNRENEFQTTLRAKEIEIGVLRKTIKDLKDEQLRLHARNDYLSTSYRESEGKYQHQQVYNMNQNEMIKKYEAEIGRLTKLKEPTFLEWIRNLWNS